MTDASIKSASYAFMTGENPEHKPPTQRKTNAIVASIKTSLPLNLNKQSDEKNFWPFAWPFSNLHIYEGDNKAIINYSHVSRFFWSMAIPLSLWNGYD